MSNVALLITVNNPGAHSPQQPDRTALPSRSLDSSAHRRPLAGEQCRHLPESISAPPGCRVGTSLCIRLRGQQCLFAGGRRRIKKILLDKNGHAPFLFMILVEKASFRTELGQVGMQGLWRVLYVWASKTRCYHVMT